MTDATTLLRLPGVRVGRVERWDDGLLNGPQNHPISVVDDLGLLAELNGLAEATFADRGERRRRAFEPLISRRRRHHQRCASVAVVACFLLTFEHAA